MKFFEGEPKFSEDELIHVYQADLSIDGNTILDMQPGQAFTINTGVSLITGESGSGKSALLGAIMGHIPQAETHTEVNPRIANSQPFLSRVALFSAFQSSNTKQFNFAYVEQEPRFNGSMPIVDHLKSTSQILHGITLKDSDIERSAEMLGIEHIVFEERQRSANVLSGGEKQRVAILSSLVGNPDIIFADEPTAAVDPLAKEGIFKIYRDIADQRPDTGIVIVTHDVELGSKFADTTIAISPQAQEIQVS